MSWVIRDYAPDDLAGCLSVMRSNLPVYFAQHEVDGFVIDLQQRALLPEAERWPYFVLATGEKIRACGGYSVNINRVATLVWGMVLKSEHESGLGTALLNYRTMHMKKKAEVVEIDTTPAAFGFYHKFGFEQTAFEKDGYGIGLDKIFARLPL